MSFAKKSISAIRRVSSGTLDKFGDASRSLSRLIARQEWDSVRDMLSEDSDEETKNALSSAQFSSDENSSSNILHYTCQYYPPWDVVKLLDKLNPAFITQIDTMGRTVLHIAAKRGASPQVIRYLCAKNPDAAKIQDITGKTALHLACQFYPSKYNLKKNDDIPLKESMRDVIRTIIRAHPTSVNIEDIDGMAAIEYAIENDADLKVVRDIQKACEKDWKKRKTSGQKHEHLKKDLMEEFHAHRNNLRLEFMKLTDTATLLSSASDGLGKESESTPRPVKLLSSRRTQPRSKRALCA